MYLAIMNLPGYLPDTEPIKFNTAREAWQYLIEELERDRDIEIELEDYPALDEFEYAIQFATETRDLDTIGCVEADGLIYAVERIEQ